MLELHCRVQGDTGLPPLVLLHGLFGAASNWSSIARRLASRYRVLVPDLRNHGRSPHHADCSFQALTEDLHGLLDEQSITATILVGHSMGGKAAMQFALTYPQSVTGLAVVDMAPVRYGHDFAPVLAGFDAVDLARIDGRADADRQMAAQVPDSDVRAFLLQNLVQGRDGWAWRCNLVALAAAQGEITDFPDHAPGTAFPGPTSFIHGALSDYVMPAHLPTIRRLFPAASLCAVADAGHWVYADQVAGFMACLQEFLAECG